MTYPDFRALTHPGIRSMQPYIPGKSIEEVAREQGRSDIIKLASNENAWGCSPAVKYALQNITEQDFSLYPQYSHHAFYYQLASYLQIEQNMLTLGNGSDVLVGLLLNCFVLHQPKHVLTHRYAFMTYKVQAQTLGIPINIAPTGGLAVDIDELIQNCYEDTAIIFIANPNNPTGLLIEQDEIIRLLENIPKTTLLVLDEAYHEYAHQNKTQSIDLMNKYCNFVILRTFSKAYGLAGLRLGYAIAHPEITQLLRRIQLPFTVNIAALTAAEAALQDQSFIEKTIQLTQAGLNFLQRSFDSLSIEYLPTRANFITIDCKQPAVNFFQRFQSHGIILRPLDAYEMQNYLRITVGTESQNQRLIEVFQRLLTPTE